jgi:TolA-binding protein
MRARSLLLALTIVMAACSQAANPAELTNQGYEALRSGDYKAAEEDFARALEALGTDTAQPAWQRAKLGLIEARTHTDAARAKTEFLEYAEKGAGSSVSDKDFALIGGRLGEAGKLDEAIAVLTVGMKAFPESPHLTVLMDKLGDMAKSAGSSSALVALKGLGYVGD